MPDRPFDFCPVPSSNCWLECFCKTVFHHVSMLLTYLTDNYQQHQASRPRSIGRIRLAGNRRYHRPRTRGAHSHRSTRTRNDIYIDHQTAEGARIGKFEDLHSIINAWASFYISLSGFDQSPCQRRHPIYDSEACIHPFVGLVFSSAA